MSHYVGHQRSSLFADKSIHLGRCVKRQLIRRLSSLNVNASALSDSPKALLRSSFTLATFNHRHDVPPTGRIPPAPPLPPTMNDYPLSKALKSTEFSAAIQNRTSSPSTIKSIPSTNRSRVLPTPRNRRRTPLTPDILALTKLRRPEHIKSSIAQRIEELKQASLLHRHVSDEKLPAVNEPTTDLLVTCDYKNTPSERQWLNDQAQSSAPMKFLSTQNCLQLSHRLFQIRSIEFLDHSTVRFHAREQHDEPHFPIKQISLLTILILSVLRLIENTLSNLSIPGVKILLNLIYVLILITIAIPLLTNHTRNSH